MRKFYIFLLLIVLAIIACSHGSNNSREDEAQRKIPAEAIHPLINEGDLEVLINNIGDARIVLLGESSHGTAEFYTWRAAISKKLITEKGFNIIAVEGDWADAYPVNDYIKNGAGTSANAVLNNFNRWPQWMWKNEEVADLVEWLKTWNSQNSGSPQVGFYGLDVYGIWESLETVYQSLLEIDQEAALQAREAIDCFKKFNFDEQQYARATLNGQSCADELQNLLSSVQDQLAISSNNDKSFNLLENTLVAVNSENYYRTAVKNSSASWNIRDRHM